MNQERKKFGKVKRFLGLDLIYGVNRSLYHSFIHPLKNLKSIRNKNPQEFSVVQKKYNLTEDDLRKKSTLMFYYGIVTLILGTLVFFYLCLYIHNYSFTMILNYLIVTFILYLVSFRYFYFRYLIQKRKLGVSIYIFIKDIFYGNY